MISKEINALIVPRSADIFLATSVTTCTLLLWFNCGFPFTLGNGIDDDSSYLQLGGTSK